MTLHRFFLFAYALVIGAHAPAWAAAAPVGAGQPASTVREAVVRGPAAWSFETSQWNVPGRAAGSAEATSGPPALRWDGRIVHQSGAMAAEWSMVSQIDAAALPPMVTRHVLLPAIYFREIESDLPFFTPYRFVGRPENYQTMIKADAASGFFLEGWLGVIGGEDWRGLLASGGNGAPAGTEEVDGIRCTVYRVGTPEDPMTLWVDEQAGVLRKATRIQRFGKLTGARGLLSQARGQVGIDRIERELSGVRAEEIEGGWFPVAGQLTTVYRYADGSSSAQITRTERGEFAVQPGDEALFEIPDPVVVYTDAGYLAKERRGGEMTAYLDPSIAHAFARLEKVLAGVKENAGTEDPAIQAPVGEPLAAGVALAAALRLAGADGELVDLVPETWPDRDPSLTDVADAAAERGFKVRPLRRLEARDLPKLVPPVILRLKADRFSRRPNTYAVLAGTAGEQMILFEANRGVEAVSWKELNERWGGAGLIVGREQPRLPAVGAWFAMAYAIPLGIGLLALGGLRVASARCLRATWPWRRQWIDCAMMGALSVPLALGWNAIHPAGALANRQATENIHLAHYGDLAPVVDSADVAEIVEAAPSDTLLIDARTPAEYAADHVPGAINLPLDLPSHVRQEAVKEWPRSRRLILYCGGESCNIAEYMASRLASEGFNRIEIYKEGLEGWNALMRRR